MDTLILAVRVVLSLAVVLGLLWYMQRRLTRSARSKGTADLVNVVSRQGLSPKASVVVVDTEGKRFLLGVTEQSVSVLHTSDAPVEEMEETEAVHASGAAAFARSLTGARAGTGYPPRLVPAPAETRSGRRAARTVPTAQPADSKLAGSVLSPATWKQTAAVLRQGR